MEFIKAMEIRHRLCNSRDTISTGKCIHCPLMFATILNIRDCSEIMQCYPAEAEKILTEWDKANPVKTYLTDFLEKYPNAPMDCDWKTPKTCPHDLGYCEESICEAIHGDCLKCWSTPLEAKTE